MLIVISLIAGSSFSSFGDVKVSTPYDETTINADLNSTVIPDHIALSWSDDPMTTQTVTWRTNTTVSFGQVKYKKQTDSKYLISEAVKPTLFKTDTTDYSANGKMNTYSVVLKKLTPGTKYTYLVGYGNNWSAENTFTTEAANTKNFKFLIFGDSQSGNYMDPNYEPWHVTVQNAYNKNKDAKFFVNMGDYVEIGHYYIHWDSWFNAVKGVIDKIPDMVVQGNHETYLQGVTGE